MDIKSEIKSVLSIFIPQVLIDNFEMTDQINEGEKIFFYFSEKKEIPQQYKDKKLHSKGFYEEFKVQDFPIRGKEVYYYIKRRKWIDIETKKILSKELKLVEKGTRMTNDFADFLKEYYR